MRREIVLLMLAGCVLSGCATKRTPSTFVHHPPPIAVPEMPPFSAIIADDGVAQLSAELSPDVRQAFKERRDAYVKQQLEEDRTRPVDPGRVAEGVGAGVYACIYAGVTMPIIGLVVCPFTIVGGAIVGAAGPSTTSGGGLPYATIPGDEFERLADFFNNQVTAGMLAKRTLKLIARPAAAGSHLPQNRLVVRLRAAQLSYIWYPLGTRRSVRESARNPVEMTLQMRITAEAEAILADGTTLPVTEHTFEWQYGPIPRWAGTHREAVEEGFIQSLDALAQSIASTYVPTPKVGEDSADKQAVLVSLPAPR